MPDYPRAFELEPIAEWPGTPTTTRERSRFRSQNGDPVTIGTTMGELQTELDQIRGTRPRLGIAVTREDLRLDGRLRANAQPWHPGVVLSFDTPRGPMRLSCDRYTRWEDNLRAIVKTLNALRAIDRWGATHGEQYGGFLAIESARAMPSAPFSDAPEAVEWIVRLLARITPESIVPLTAQAASGDARSLLRKAQAATHPDRGGDGEQFRLVSLAEQILREAGAL